MVNFYGEEKKQLAGAGSRLLKAAKDGDLEALIESLDKGANIFETDESEQASVLHYATYNGKSIISPKASIPSLMK